MKRGQITIFIIVGVVIISVVILFFLFKSGIVPKIFKKPETDSNTFLHSCMEDKIKEAVKTISLQGGHINNPLHKTFKFENEDFLKNISYLCYTQNYYTPCINQEPMLIQHLKDEIKDYIFDDVKDCFNELTLSLEKQDYVVEARYNGFYVELIERKIVIKTNSEIILTKGYETSKQENFKIIVPSRFYDLSIVVQEIISQEARFCHFEHLGFMLLYPEFEIDKFRTGDLTTIYTVEYRKSKEKFRFAVKSCVIPPGI